MESSDLNDKWKEPKKSYVDNGIQVNSFLAELQKAMFVAPEIF